MSGTLHFFLVYCSHLKNLECCPSPRNQSPPGIPPFQCHEAWPSKCSTDLLAERYQHVSLLFLTYYCCIVFPEWSTTQRGPKRTSGIITVASKHQWQRWKRVQPAVIMSLGHVRPPEFLSSYVCTYYTTGSVAAHCFDCWFPRQSSGMSFNASTSPSLGLFGFTKINLKSIIDTVWYTYRKKISD